MLKIFITFALLALTLAANLEAQWEDFKFKYNKVYETTQEEQYRQHVWLENKEYIETHNQQYEAGEHSFYLGENQFTDMPNDEFRYFMNGYIQREQPSNAPVHKQNSRKYDLPDTVDWRTKGLVTPIKNQGQCGSCWAFSSTGSLEGQTKKKYGKLISLSEQNLVDCSQKQGNQGCNGGLMDYAFTYVKDNHGLDTEESYPYEGEDAKCRFDPKNVGANDTGFVDIKSKDEEALQEAVATVGPISVAIDASHLSFQLYRGGVYHSFLCSQTRLDHGVLAVGYGKQDDKDYWLVKNSWGTTWGEKGYILMSRNRDNNCGIATQASYPTV